MMTHGNKEYITLQELEIATNNYDNRTVVEQDGFRTSYKSYWKQERSISVMKFDDNDNYNAYECCISNVVKDCDGYSSCSGLPSRWVPKLLNGKKPYDFVHAAFDLSCPLQEYLEELSELKRFNDVMVDSIIMEENSFPGKEQQFHRRVNALSVH
ncbi:hypothetical protein CUMW_199700 [Citrus unshiu]|nr:hypothetical protein CUMW_199700 [Citrus unshiu]